ncbi:hypothetical protein B566_EDAN000185 [Ephemera danica]|nr:hypothetical protein B566_EDAN000185 [Ephemera danica]
MDICENIIQKTSVNGLFILPSNADLAGAEIELANVNGREHHLRDAIKEIHNAYDVIVLDCPPALGILTINALAAAKSVLIPVQCEYYAMEGLSRLISSIERVKQSINLDLFIEGIVLTMFDARNTLARQVSEQVRNHFGSRVYQAVIPRNVSLAEAPSYGRPGILYNMASSGSQAYLSLAKEFLDHGEKSTRIDAIVPNRYQPRQIFHPAELAELAASIKESGLLQPILVRRKGDGIFELISGERRWRATKEAGLATIQAVVRNCSDQEAILFALVENIQREDLNPMETARAYSRMMNEFGLTHDSIAQKVGRDRSSVTNSVRLLNLHHDVQALVESGAISAGHAKVILGIDTPETQCRIAKTVAAHALSVRETERLVTTSSTTKKRTNLQSTTSQWSDIEARLQKRFGTRVTIEAGRKGGKVIIHYYSAPELEGIVDNLLS